MTGTQRLFFANVFIDQDSQMENRHVLVVEDDSSVATITAEMLRILGYSAVVAASSEGAMAAWREFRGDFHLVIVDFILSDGSGAMLATTLVAEKPGIPVILISGLTEDNVDLPLARARYLAKPFTITHLRHAIDSLIPR